MFTGITEDIGLIKSISARDPAEYKIENKMDLKKSLIGSSIMCSGICLTVINKGENYFRVDISEETLKRLFSPRKVILRVSNVDKKLYENENCFGHSGRVLPLGDRYTRAPPCS